MPRTWPGPSWGQDLAQLPPRAPRGGGGGARAAHLVRVPQADGTAQGHLAHQQVVHPAEGELQVPHLVLVQVPVDLPCRDKHRPRGCQESPRRPAPSLRPWAHLGTPPTSRATAPKEHGRKRNFHSKTSDSLPQGIRVVTAVTVTRTTTAPAGGVCAPSGMPRAPPQEHGQAQSCPTDGGTGPRGRQTLGGTWRGSADLHPSGPQAGPPDTGCSPERGDGFDLVPAWVPRAPGPGQ